jgi:hypothetical protein
MLPFQISLPSLNRQLPLRIGATYVRTQPWTVPQLTRLSGRLGIPRWQYFETIIGLRPNRPAHSARVIHSSASIISPFHFSR